MSHQSTCGPIGWETDAVYPKHTLMALDDTTLLSRAAVAADVKKRILGHLTEDSEALDGDTQLNGATGLFSTTSHQSIVKEGTVTGIASSAIAKGDEVGIGTVAGQFIPDATNILGIAVSTAGVGEYFAYLPTA